MRAVCHNLTETFPNGANYVPVVCDQCTWVFRQGVSRLSGSMTSSSSRISTWLHGCVFPTLQFPGWADYSPHRAVTPVSLCTVRWHRPTKSRDHNVATNLVNSAPSNLMRTAASLEVSHAEDDRHILATFSCEWA
jgi:hypothetical protein